MSTMVNYVCWEPDMVAATIATEAASPSHAVLLATHTPLTIRRDGDGDASDSISEQEFLDGFLSRPAKEGVVVAPILGQSGSGKSHLVRWVQAMMPEAEGRHVIYLPKTHTSLRQVIEKLLDGAEGEIFDDVRSQLSGLREAIDPDVLERRLLNELAECVRTAVPGNDFRLKALVGEHGLQVLFHDQLFRDFLLQSGSFINRRAEHALRGKLDDEDDIPSEFTIADLPLSITDRKSIDDANVSARSMYKRLAADPSLQVTAVALLNQFLDVAMMRAADLGVGTVQEAFMALREKLVGQEIILLIEDFALIQGIRRDLLDAIIEVGTVAGVERYATVRTMMAVTTGYYGNLDDTFRTRAEASSPIYRVDVAVEGNSGVVEQPLVDFVGRYLNAARLGANVIERGPADLNACQSCVFMQECHATFGASKAGHGLYPYNDTAMRRSLRITADVDSDGRTLFNPRRVLSRMVRGVLIEDAASIRDGRFPSTNFLSEERERETRLPAAQRLPDVQLADRMALEERYEEPEYSRYLTTFQFWGGTSLKVEPGTYSAFSLPPVDIEVVDRPQPPVAAVGGSLAPSGQGEMPIALRRKLDDVDNWSRGSVMPQAVAAELRRIVRNALVAGLEWWDPIVKDPAVALLKSAVPDGTQAQRTVSIVESRENLAAGTRPIVQFDQTPANAVLFQSLLLFNNDPTSAPEALISLRDLADRYRVEVTRRVVEAGEYGTGSLVAAAASLIYGAALCGELPAKPKVRDYIRATLWSGRGDEQRDDTRTFTWQGYEKQYRIAREETVLAFRAALGVSQGSGAVHAIDDPRITSIVAAATKLTGVPGIDQLPTWCKVSDKARSNLDAAVQHQKQEWSRLIEGIREHVPEGTLYTATVDAIRAATEAGRTLGFVKAELASVDLANAAARDSDFGEVKKLEASLAASESIGALEAASEVGRANGTVARDVRNYLVNTAAWLEAGLAAAEAHEEIGTLNVADEVDDVLAEWEQIVTEDAGSES